MTGDRRGFTLVETVFAVALFCFAIALVGPLLTRVARMSNSVTGVQRRTAAVTAASAAITAFPFTALGDRCRTESMASFSYTMCVDVTDTLTYLRRVRIVVTPSDTAFGIADTVTIYRVDGTRINPFNSP